MVTGTPPPPPPPPPSQRLVNTLSVLALTVAIASAFFTYQQASEAKRANNELQATQAQGVYIDAPLLGSDGRVHHLLVNRNKAPITNVYYTYTIGPDKDLGPPITVGSVPGCSSIELLPAAIDIPKIAFTPIAAFFTDPSGGKWQREYGGGPIEADISAIANSPQEQVNRFMAIAQC